MPGYFSSGMGKYDKVAAMGTSHSQYVGHHLNFLAFKWWLTEAGLRKECKTRSQKSPSLLSRKGMLFIAFYHSYVSTCSLSLPDTMWDSSQGQGKNMFHLA
jgi:hypothetical protein